MTITAINIKNEKKNDWGISTSVCLLLATALLWVQIEVIA